MTVVTFSDISPPTRHDGLPWNRIEVQESLVEVGPYASLPIVTLFPLDGDPTNPAERNFTVTSSFESGWYRLRFLDSAEGYSSWSVPVYNSPLDYDLPEVRDVADRLYVRTVDAGGNYIGTFTTATTPNAERVTRLIYKARDEVYGRVGSLTQPGLIRSATELITIYTAMLIELSHYPDQIRQGRSPYEELKKLYDAGLMALIEAVGGDGGSAIDDAEGEALSGAANYGFPETSIGDGVMP